MRIVNKRWFRITSSVLLALVITVFTILGFLIRVPIETVEGYASTSPQQRAIASPIYTSPLITQTARNNWDISFVGSGSKIHVGNKADIANNHFKPNLTFGRWNDEAILSLNLNMAAIGITNNLGNASLSGDTITLNNNAVAFTFRPTPPKEEFNDLGGFDFLITLKQKPPVNSLSFSYNPSLVEAYLQPPLTTQYISGWSEEFQTNIIVTETQVTNTQGEVFVNRPSHAVNSIAFYLADGKSGDYSLLGGENYQAGKVGHLYRLQVTDNLSTKVWADWSLSGNTITLTVPQSFINSAKYPIVIAPVGDTFGYTTAGLSTQNNIRRIVKSYGTYTPAAGTGVSVSQYAYSTISAGYRTNFGLYDDAATPAKVSNTGTVTIPLTTPAWVTANFTTPANPALTAQAYRIAFDFETNASNAHYDTNGAVAGFNHGEAVYTTWDATIATTAGLTQKWSIYSTYTPSGGAAFIPKIWIW